MTLSPARTIRGPHVETTKDGRFYVWGGEKFWSVTTIINGGIPKPALINWAKKFTAEYAVNNLSALNELVKADPDGAIDWLKNAAYRDRDRKADLGSRVHEAAEAYVLGRPFPEWDAAVKPLMDSFVDFLTEFQPHYVAVEAPVFSRLQRYAGTLDAIAEFDHDGLRLLFDVAPDKPVRLLLDTKTGKGVYPEVGLQLAAYRYSETFVGMPDTSEEPTPEVDGCAVLHLMRDGYRLIPVRADQELFKAFLFCREVYRYGLEIARTVVGRPVRGRA